MRSQDRLYRGGEDPGMWRTERDELGDVRLEANTLWGASTERVRSRRPEGRLPQGLWEMLGVILRSSVMTNEDLGFVTIDRAEWIAMAAAQVVDGSLREFLIAGPEWSSPEVFRNAVEVVTNRSLECMGGEFGSGDPVHPLQHVALHLEAERTLDLAVRLAVARSLESRWVSAYHELFPALERLLALPEGRWGPPGFDERFWPRVTEFSALELGRGGETEWRRSLQLDLGGRLEVDTQGDWPLFGSRLLLLLG